MSFAEGITDRYDTKGGAVKRHKENMGASPSLAMSASNKLAQLSPEGGVVPDRASLPGKCQTLK